MTCAARILWYSDDISKLSKVMIEAKGLAYAEAFNDPLADAIRKAPVLIVVAAKNFPSFMKFIRRNIMKFRELAG